MNIIKPTLCYGVGTKKDNGYNFYASIGADIFRKHNHFELSEYNFLTNENCNINFLRTAAEKASNPIICLACEYQSALQVVATEFPKIHFTILHTVVNLPNVQSIVFDSRGGAFLAGMAAGIATKSGIIGIISTSHDFSYRGISGFLDGVQFVNKTVKLTQKIFDENKFDYYNFDTGYTTAKNQIAEGADIIFTFINQANHGALFAAKDAGRLAIGSYLNQNHLYPGSVLTSFVFRIDKVVYDLLLESTVGRWKPGVRHLGLEDGIKDGIFDWVQDRFNRDLISDAVAAKINQAKADIICGRLQVS